MDLALKQFLDNFFRLGIANHQVRVPYWRNRFYKDGRRVQGPFGGKGTAAEIRRAALEKARQSDIDLTAASAGEIRSFLRQKRIGIDCSGFAFQILNFLQPGFWRGLEKAPGRSNNPRRRFNSWALTNDANSVMIKPFWANLHIGDIIPVAFSRGKVDHVMVIVAKSAQQLYYAHSSGKTKTTGPHLGVILLRDGKQPLWQQKWPEKLKSGQLLLQKARPALETRGIRRLRPFVVR